MARFSFLWIPHFAAWAAVQADPALHRRPVVVHQGGRIIAVSRLAEQGGAQVGWTVHRAQSQLPEAVLWPLHGPTVAGVWSEVIAALLELTPCLESQRPGALVADLRPPQLVVPVLRQWQAQGDSGGGGIGECGVGVCGVGQCGVADDRTTAEVAAFTAAPGTLRQIRPGHSLAFLRHVPLNTLSWAGLRADTLQRMGWFGWRYIGDLSGLTRRQLVTQFDQGALLYRYAQASDVRPVGFFRSPPTASAAFTFETPVREPYQWQAVLDLLVEQALSDLNGRGAQTLTLQIATPRGLQRRHRLLHDLTAEKRVFYEAAHWLLIDHLREAPRGAESFFQLRVTLAGLTALPAVQGSLFGRERPPVQVAVRAMQERFPGALRQIVMLDRCAYLPETAFRFDPITTENIENETAKRIGKRTGKGKVTGVQRQGRVSQRPAHSRP